MQISRQINHTGRIHIKRSEVQIEVVETKDVPEFRANLKLDTSRLPANADIYIEAYHRNTSQRFEFGTVAAPRDPESLKLDQLDLSGPTLFRLKIVDNTEQVGRLIASAEGISPSSEDESKNESLMTFRSSPGMGNLTWKVVFEGDKPVLCINNKIPEGKSLLLNNPMFSSLILPAAFREVLLKIYMDEGFDEEEGWQANWLSFAREIAPEELVDPDDLELVLDWINDVAGAFSDQHHMCQNLILKMEDQGDA
ncbi:hypothetical protein [Marinobacter sp.]|uniref:hypothetical protein n=1 Tax=Marinobacter sp. TaxID=50741 RepID=UPI002626C1A2|nr:hypothetical protein [Marinobacter sp.]